MRTAFRAASRKTPIAQGTHCPIGVAFCPNLGRCVGRVRTDLPSLSAKYHSVRRFGLEFPFNDTDPSSPACRGLDQLQIGRKLLDCDHGIIVLPPERFVKRNLSDIGTYRQSTASASGRAVLRVPHVPERSVVHRAAGSGGPPFAAAASLEVVTPRRPWRNERLFLRLTPWLPGRQWCDPYFDSAVRWGIDG